MEDAQMAQIAGNSRRDIDLERLLGKISVATGSARDIIGIALFKCACPTINLIKTAKTNLIKELHDELFGLKNLEPLKEKILATIRRILRYR